MTNNKYNTIKPEQQKRRYSDASSTHVNWQTAFREHRTWTYANIFHVFQREDNYKMHTT